MKSLLFRISILCLSIFFIYSCQQKPHEIIHSKTSMDKDWSLQSSSHITEDGAVISLPGYNSSDWYKTTVPSTVLAALARNNVYEDIFFSDNFDKIPEEPFMIPWWYRKSFDIEETDDGINYQLIFEGINYKANVWLNGKRVASSDNMEQPFRIFDFNVSDYLVKGENVLAVEIIPPVKGDLTIGYVDWNPWPADNNMGIWRPVKLLKTGAVSLKHIFVKPKVNVETLDEATLRISAVLSNHLDESIKSEVVCSIEDISISQQVILEANEVREIVFDVSDYDELHILNPRLWWPNNLGDPELYTLNIEAKINSDISDSEKVRFGIREVSDYINETGHRGYIINGERTLIKGAGWVDDVLLDESDQKIKSQIEYVKHMNLNTIRLEGFWGKNQSIYDYADENGILIMIGWSCHWEWEGYCGRPEEEFMSINIEENDLHAQAYMDQVYWLRNHPSIFLWVHGSDKLLKPELEKRLYESINLEDGTRPILGCCKDMTSELAGPTAVKMRGPYSYVTPNYWYVDTLLGGAFGFNTETGPGIQPSPLESVKKMVPEDQLWPLNEIWDYHLGRNEFKTFKFWLNPFNNRYGEAQSVEEFTFKAQMANYEAMRPMFEAFAVNKHKATGVIQWMLNSAWPGMLWQLYDWYLMPNGAFYATKKACEPLNIVYNYNDRNIYLTNDYRKSFENLTAEVKVLDIDSKEIFSKKLEVKIGSNTSEIILEMPELIGLTTTYFLDLKLHDNKGKEVTNNFYWLSKKEDVLDLEGSDWFITYNKSYADMTGINSMPESEIKVNHKFTEAGENQEVIVSIENPSDRIAFFIELSLRDKETGNTILPVFWDDNYISLLPGEKRQINGYVKSKDVKDEGLIFNYKGWNINP